MCAHIVTHIISSISAAFYTPRRSLKLQHKPNFGKKKKVIVKPYLPFCSFKEVHGKKKKKENERKISFISVGNPNPGAAAKN